MPNPLNLLTKKVKDKIAQRNYEKDSKYIIDFDLDPIDPIIRDRLAIRDSTYSDVFEDEDDTRSVSSYSTMATMNSNRGAGYTVDKYFFQPVGRRIEKIAFQIAMPFLPPGRVVQYIEERLFQGYFVSGSSHVLLLDSVCLTGLNSLVHQTQSNSVIRSSAALSALCRLCRIELYVHIFYNNFRRRVRNANLAVLSVDNEDLEKKCYLFLETLSWAQIGLWELNPVYNVRYQGTLHMKASLLRLVQSWRTSDNDALAIIPEACILLASVLFTPRFFEGVEEYERLYFFLLFILRFPSFIYYRATHYKCKQRAQQLYHLLLTTLLRWLDSVLSSYLSSCVFPDLSEWEHSTGSLLEKRLAVYGLLRYESAITTHLPVTTRRLSKDKPFDIKFLPRNLRSSGRHLTVIHNLIERSSARTQRLLKSIDELEREIRDSMTITKSEDEYYYEEMYDDEFEYMQEQARSVHVLDSNINEEFLKARRSIPWDWRRYKRYCRIRHQLGIYFRSYLDWEWDTASCLERLFELPDEPVSSPAPIATVKLDTGEADTWNISTEATLPQKMKVAYKSARGETKYKTFMVCPSTEDVASTGELAQDDKEQEGVSVILPEPHCGGGEVAAEGSGVVAHANNDAAAAPGTDVEIGVADNRSCSDDSANEEDTEEISQNLKERQVDQISICSLD